ASVIPSNTQHGSQGTINITFRCCPRRDADSHGSMALPHRPSTPTRPLGLDAVNHPPRDFVVTERHEHLIEHHLIQNSITPIRESFCETPGVPARALDEVRQARPAEAAERSPYL